MSFTNQQQHTSPTTTQNMTHISKTLRNKKVISKNFKCPYCSDDMSFTFFDWESKLHKWECTACGNSGRLDQLSSVVDRINALSAQMKAEKNENKQGKLI